MRIVIIRIWPSGGTPFQMEADIPEEVTLAKMKDAINLAQSHDKVLWITRPDDLQQALCVNLANVVAISVEEKP